jgi:hypothetical protein
MSHFQNKNKVWISNTLKTNNETLGIIKLLKDLGLFREKTKRRKPKKPAKEEEEEDEFLVPPIGGGGGGASVGLLPSSNISQALQALKSGASSQAQQQYLLEKAREDAQLAIGKFRDISQQQIRPNLGVKPSASSSDFLAEETGEEFFPQKESVVSEPSQEFKREINGPIPDDVMEVDISDKVGEQGIMEDEEEEYILEQPEEYTIRPASKMTMKEKTRSLRKTYKIKSFSESMRVDDLKKYLIDLYFRFNIDVPDDLNITSLTKKEVLSLIRDLISLKFKEDNPELFA